MLRIILVIALSTCAGLLAGCDNCLGKGRHGVPDPGPGEWQFVFSSYTGREVGLFVNGEKAGVVCENAKEVTIGNYPIHSCTIVRAHIRETAKDCFYSPNCTDDCDAQVCDPDTCLDTEGLGWEGQRIEFTLHYK